MKRLKVFEDFGDETLSKIKNPTQPEVLKDLLGSKDKWTGRIIQYAVYFEPTGTFSALNTAKEWLNKEGYASGSMYMNYPIIFKKDSGGNCSVTTKWGEQRPVAITKWDRISPAQFQQFDGVLEPVDEFREGGVRVIFYVFPD